MGLLEWLAEKGIYEVKRAPPPPEKKPTTISQRTPEADELALGFAKTEDMEGNETWVLKGVSQEHRATHFYVVGASGSGKTKFLETLATQDVENSEGFGIIDANSDLTEDLKGYLYLA